MQRLLIFVILLLLALGFCWIVEPDHVKDFLIYYNQPIATLSYIAIILSAVFVAVQAYLFKKDYKTRLERAEFEKAYVLAGYYAKEILPRLSFASEFLNILNKTLDSNYYQKSKQFKNFTAAEAQVIFGDNVIKNFWKLFSSTNVISANASLLIFASMNNFLYTGLEQKWINLENKSDTTKLEDWQMHSIRVGMYKLLNDIEYFSTYFCSNLASSKVVYMILHQTFIDFIINAYLFICASNTEVGHEYYAHTIELYKKWLSMSEERDKKLCEAIEPEKPKKVHS